MKGNRVELEMSQMQTPLAVFLTSYNQSIPATFPRVSASLLKKFQTAHPTLFKHGDTWSVAQHRKRLIDWLFMYRDAS